ncbi:MAG: hypothetical protein IJH04_04810 [Eggerthellaceae bacterium]|nr:hypothetical protein [Eggerthellaceae bacterium]
MADNNQLNTAWLSNLTNAHHDGTTQQIDDFVQSFETDNARFREKAAALHQARQKEDEVWLKALRDEAVPQLSAADKRQDAYIAAVRYIVLAHAGLPDGEATKQEALACEQVFKDFKFSTKNAYGAESDKIIQMQQNLQAHQSFLTQAGAWTFLTQAVAAAQQVRQLLGQRARTTGEVVTGEMKTVRRQTDLAVADLYKLLAAMQELMPSASLTTLVTQLRGIELYAKQYYIPGASGASSNTGGTSSGSSESTGGTTEGGSTSGTGTGSGTGSESGSGTGTGSGGDNTGTGSDGGDDNGEGGGGTGNSGDIIL